MQPNFDEQMMMRALKLAERGRGFVEPNPLVGCVIVRGGIVVGEGWHQRFGGPHAEVEALKIAGTAATGATMYVTLEPCCHFGKTPPCSSAVIAAGIGRVVVAMRDPFPAVDGGGIRQLEAAGIQVEIGILETESRDLNLPYLKLISQKQPWILAKWAMTLDGKIATKSGDSRWISGEKSRACVHQIRGRMDGILVGLGTALADDPALTARPAGPRVATRIVLDSNASLPVDCQLVRTAHEVPVLIVASVKAEQKNCDQLRALGCEVVQLTADDRIEFVGQLLDELGSRRLTNILVEGGAAVLGSFFDAQAVDEVHVFIGPKILGGEGAKSPLGGFGQEKMADALILQECSTQILDGDIYIQGRISKRK